VCEAAGGAFVCGAVVTTYCAPVAGATTTLLNGQEPVAAINRSEAHCCVSAVFCEATLTKSLPIVPAHITLPLIQFWIGTLLVVATFWQVVCVS
jgi:hypothetical protein